MVVIRLSRGGPKKSPFYHLVVADSRRPRDGRFIERLGYFNPMARGKDTRLQVRQERIQHWVSLGAQPSERVSFLLEELATRTSAVEETRPTRAEMRKTQAAASQAIAAQKAQEAAAAARAAEAAQAAEATDSTPESSEAN